jgi:hypothetical protein
VEHPVEAVGVALVVAVHVPPAAAVADVVDVDVHLVLARAEPLLEQVRLGVGPEDELTGGVELAGDIDERHARRGADLRLAHGVSLSAVKARCAASGFGAAALGASRARSTWSCASNWSSRWWLSSQNAW